MYAHVLVLLVGLHLISAMVCLYLITEPHQLKVSGTWLFSRSISWLNPAYRIDFPNTDRVIRTTAQAVTNSAAVRNYTVSYLHSLLRCFYISSTVYLLFPLAIMFFRQRSYRQSQQRYLRGAKLITPQILFKEMKNRQDKADLPFGKIKMPVAAERKSCFCIGRPGAGKTTLFSQVLERLEQRQEKVLVYDFKGDYLEKFYNPDTDIIFNPLDQRSTAWNIFSEIEHVTDIDSIAASLIPTASVHTDPFWSDGARDVFSGILHYLYQNNFRTNQDVWKMLTADAQTLRDILQSTPGGAKGFRYLENTDADGSGSSTKQAISILAVMMQHCACFEYMTDDADSFCLSDWIKHGTGRIFLTSNASVKDSLRPILSLFIDLLAKKLLSQSENPADTTYIILDEFGSLQKLPAMIELLTLGRSKGSSVWIGIQDVGRLDFVYGRELRQTIINACGSHIIFPVTDRDTTKYCSDLIGETEFLTADKNLSMGVANHRGGTGLNYRKHKEPLLLPSDISQLPDLNCVVKFSNYHPLITQLKYKPFTSTANSFEIRPDLIL